MASTKTTTLLLAVLCLFLVSEIGMLIMVDGQAPIPDCEPKCASRCSKSWKPKMCLKTCNACCNTCNGCVPPGPTANKDVCPCYAQYKNGKCP